MRKCLHEASATSDAYIPSWMGPPCGHGHQICANTQLRPVKQLTPGNHFLIHIYTYMTVDTYTSNTDLSKFTVNL